MSIKKAVTASFITGAVALAVASTAPSAKAMSDDKEKCYGIVKAGHNDCGNAAKTHSCMGLATVDGDGGEWIAVPKGLCEKIVGGSLTPKKDEEKSMDDKEG